MKKSLILLSICLLLLGLAACSSKAAPGIGTYITEGGEAELRLMEDGQFVLFRPMLSYAPAGTYAVEGQELRLISAENDHYVFRCEGDKLIFISGAWLEDAIPEGTELKLSPAGD